MLNTKLYMYIFLIKYYQSEYNYVALGLFYCPHWTMLKDYYKILCQHKFKLLGHCQIISFKRHISCFWPIHNILICIPFFSVLVYKCIKPFFSEIFFKLHIYCVPQSHQKWIQFQNRFQIRLITSNIDSDSISPKISARNGTFKFECW